MNVFNYVVYVFEMTFYSSQGSGAEQNYCYYSQLGKKGILGSLLEKKKRILKLKKMTDK